MKPESDSPPGQSMQPAAPAYQPNPAIEPMATAAPVPASPVSDDPLGNAASAHFSQPQPQPPRPDSVAQPAVPPTAFASSPSPYGPTPMQQPLPPGSMGSNGPVGPPQGGVFQSPMPVAPQKPSRRRKIVWSVLGAVVVAGVVGGYVLGLYLPAKPENVWNTAFTRTGKALNSLVESSATDETYKAYEKLQLSGTLDLTSGANKFKGTVDGKFDPSTVDGSLTVAYSDDTGQSYKLGLDTRSQLAKGETYPDTYLRLSGIKALGLDGFLPGVGDYDNRWIYISSEYLKTLIPTTAGEKAGQEPQITRDDVLEVSRVATRVTNEYIFTTDTTKAVVVNKAFVGKETSESVAAYHFKAGLNKTNANNYCVALGNALADTKAYKKFAATDSTASDPKADIKSSCEDSTKGIKESNSFDLWVESDHKLVQKVKVTDPEDAGNYVEFGQTYSGGNTIPQFARFHFGKDKVDINEQASLDTASKAASLTVTGKQQKTDSSEGFDMSLKLNITPYKGTVPFDKPTDSVPLPDILKRFGVDPAEFTSPASAFEESSNAI